MQKALKRVSDIEKLLERERSEKEISNKKLVNKTLADALLKAMGGREKVPSADFVIDSLISKGTVKIAEDGETTLYTLNGEDVSVEKGITALLKAQPELQRNIQSPGSGRAGGSPNNGGTKTIPEDEWLKLEPKERARVIADGVTIT